MVDDPCPITAGARGTVEQVLWLIDSYHVQVAWENTTRTLALCVPPDKIKVVA
jgi:hypothetical protein